jgi:hypothetical protein
VPDPVPRGARGAGAACYIYTFYVAVRRALFRLAGRRNGWAKTRRNAELSNKAVVALDSFIGRRSVVPAPSVPFCWVVGIGHVGAGFTDKD